MESQRQFSARESTRVARPKRRFITVPAILLSFSVGAVLFFPLFCVHSSPMLFARNPFLQFGFLLMVCGGLQLNLEGFYVLLFYGSVHSYETTTFKELSEHIANCSIGGQAVLLEEQGFPRTEIQTRWKRIFGSRRSNCCTCDMVVKAMLS